MNHTDSVRTQTPRTNQREHSTPIFPTSSFVFDDAEHMRALFADEQEGNIYSRFTNPTVAEFVQKVAAMEGASAGVATATGMAAGFASIMALLRSGDHIVSSRALFGSTIALMNHYLPRWGITCTFVDIADIDQWERAIQPNTKMLLVETPSNPGLDLADIAALGVLANNHGLILNVDNTFATPILQRPIEMGAHLVWHSATKWFDGQGRTMGGVVVGNEDFIKLVYQFCRNTGPSLSPFNAWVLSKSLETLHVRMDRHCASALTLATAVEDHPGVEFVRYPFLNSHHQYSLAKQQMSAGGGIVSLCVRGGYDAATRFMDKLTLFSITANVGDTRSIVTHPASSTHAKLTEADRQAVGITQGLVRLSVGLENAEDLVRDVMEALG
jgi:O-succinylhomoserine sulfhydrylase